MSSGCAGAAAETHEELYDDAPVGFLASFVDGRILRVNNTLADWTLRSREELLGGMRLHDLLAPGARIYYETHYAPLLQMQGGVDAIAVEIVRTDGTRLPVLMTSRLAGEQSGERIVQTTILDASERRRYERELLHARAEAESRARAALALTHVAEGVLLVGETGDVEVMNPAAESIFGVRLANAAARPAIQALPGFADIVERCPRGHVDESPAAVVLPIQVGGEERWLSAAAVGAGGATVYTIRDVTAERRLDEMRSDMVAIVSHELRTPLTGALGAAQTLESRYESLDDAMRRQLVHLLTEQCARLGRILDEILLTSELDNNNVRTSSEAFDATEVVDGVVRGVEAGARSRIVVATPEGVLVQGDLDRLRQVVANLVDNALKYSGGQVRVTVERRDFAARFTVTDEGPGIPRGDRERIFDKFFRLDPAQRSGVGGTGLGLYISRELAQRMGGRIGLLARETGAAFFVDVPLVPAA